MAEAYTLGIEGHYDTQEYPNSTYVCVHHSFESFAAALRMGRPRVVLNYLRDYHTACTEIRSFRTGFIDGLRGRVHVYELKEGDILGERRRLVRLCRKHTALYSGFYEIDTQTGDIYEVYQGSNAEYINEQGENWLKEALEIYRNIENNNPAVLNRTIHYGNHIFVDLKIGKIHLVTSMRFRDRSYRRLIRLFRL